MATKDFSKLPRTRQDAQELGIKHYYTGERCANGHIAPRYTRNNVCLQCARDHEKRRDKKRKETDPVAFNAKAQIRKRRARAANPEIYRKHFRKWYDANQDAQIQRSLEYARAHPDRVNALVSLRRAREQDAEGYYTEDDVAYLLEKQKGRCAGPGCQCNIMKCYTVDHKTPITRGGSNWPANLQLLCRPCNASKKDKTMTEWKGRRISAKELAALLLSEG